MTTVTAEETPDIGSSVDGASKPSSSPFSKEAWRRRAPLLPALLFTIVVTQVPFLFSIYYSLTDWRFLIPDSRTIVWFQNFIDLLPGMGSSAISGEVWTTVSMTALSVGLALVIGLGLAVLLDRKFFGQGFIRTLLITPFLVTPVVASLVWSNQFFGPAFGVINWLVTMFKDDPIEFTGSHAFLSVVIVIVWQWAPFMMLILLAGLQSQDSSVLEAARVDGAGRWATFRYITVPHLYRYIQLGILLGIVYISQVFDHIQVITGGRGGTKNLAFLVFESSIGGGFRFGQASAQAVFTVILSIIVATLLLRGLRSLLADGDGV